MTTDELDALRIIYVESMYRNDEMLALRWHLMGDKP